MSILLAIAAATLLGCSDFLAARAARHGPALAVTRTVVLSSVVLSPLLLLVDPGRIAMRDIIIGLLAGFSMIGGLLLLYRGYAVAPIGTVAPISSVLVGTVPVLVDLVAGRRPSAVAALGIVIGLVAVALTSYHPTPADGARSAARDLGVKLGLTSGVLFGLAFTLMGENSESSGLQPVLAQRAAGFTMLCAFGLSMRGPFLIRSRPGRDYAIAAGFFATCGIASLQLAFRDGASGPVSVAASQFATAAVILALVFNRERLRWWQGIGVGATAVGVSLMALG